MNPEPKTMLVADLSVLHDLKVIAFTRGTTLRVLVTRVLKAFIQVEKERMAAGETKLPFGYSRSEMQAVAGLAADEG